MTILEQYGFAGAFGFYGDFIYSANQTRYGSGPVEALAGPTIGPLLEVGLVQPLRAGRAMLEGKTVEDSLRKLAAQSAQDLKTFIPMQNAFYAKAALDHLVFQQVLEALSPGYLQSIRRRTQREFNQAWWWEPGETMPERLPDIGGALK